MQTVNEQFQRIARGYVRPLAWALRISFDKAFNEDIDFFTLDESILDGDDLLAPADSEPVQVWDKYLYTDYSERVIQSTWQREEDVPFSISQAMLDITLNNYDSLFTPNSGSPLADFILPKRPIRFLSGFNNNPLPQFVGLTETMPSLNRKDRKVDFHAVDFLSYLFTKTLPGQRIFIEQRTNEILDQIFQDFGLSSEQYDLDTGTNKIPFAYFPSDLTFGQVARMLMQAELGSLYMDELGVIRFVNRNLIVNTPVYDFDDRNIIDYSINQSDTIINSIEINSNIREVQPETQVFNIPDNGEVIELQAGETKTVTFKFENPVTTVEPITVYDAWSNPDGTGTDLSSNVTVDDEDLLYDSIAVTLTNSSGQDAYITLLEIDGTPAPVVRQFNYTQSDEASIEKFEEKLLIIDNDYIQGEGDAMAIAYTLLNAYAEYQDVIELEVKGTMALQLRDAINVRYAEIDNTYQIFYLKNSMQDGKFTQIIRAREVQDLAYFILDESILDGGDVLGA